MDKVDVVARTLGIVGVLLALASLTWQVFSWRLSGPRVKVSVRVAVAGTMPQTTQLAAVQAANSGRASVEVTGWGFATPDRIQLVWPRPAIGSESLPFRLEAHAGATWYAPWDDLVKLAKQHETELSSLVPFIQLGSGKRVWGKPSLRY